MDLITLEDARKGLKLAVEARGADYVYTHSDQYKNSGTCLYVGHEGEDEDSDIVVGCIVGEAFDRLGLFGTDAYHTSLYFELIDYEGSVSDLTDIHGVQMTSAAQNYLASAQIRQDRGGTWGEAISQADFYISENASLFDDTRPV